MQLEENVVFLAPDLMTFSATEDPLIFEKELVYDGTFTKGDKKFTVTKDDLLHWKDQVDGFAKSGIDVPMPLGHTTDPEKTRAKLLSIDVRPKSNGKHAAFGKLKFSDSQAAKLAKTADVSIYVEPSFKDGNGTVWKRPIRHVAFTNYPVIPGLGSFQAVAASFDGSLDMSPMVPLAQQLGIQNADQKDDAALTAEIVASFSALVDKVKKLETGGGQPGQQPGVPQPGQQQPGLPPQQKMQFSAPMLGLLRDNRLNKLDRMVGKNITKATRDELVKIHCTDDALALAFENVEGGAGDEAFDQMCAALSHNIVPGADGERTGRQGMALSNPARFFESELVKDAERRAEEARR